ncbi:LysR substrate-binding domain-containing protein [Variovorax sp. J22P271]|uniref:LysR substrate-binding domain-containing protein n=1 Tax=Variovorax davisae TaxID=3053515 RepID=UPI0025763AB8|nr:LysR substrate-binding domain-containing protein [Variovorax sp. J22P271]MDM0033770.1 LysR substrate-binding domain-containing protein [Variovorax sp. J22P271]
MKKPTPKFQPEERPKPPGTPHSRLSLARRLRLQQLLVFEKVVEVGSILGASRELALTQPAVSKSIHELEQQLGEAVFLRGKRGVVLTEFGRLLEHRAKSMLAELRLMAEELNDWQTGSAGHVVVGTLIVASVTLLPEAIARLRQEVPNVVVTVRVGPNSTLFPALARGELDVVVGVLPKEDAMRHDDGLDRAPLTHVPLYEEALRVVVGSQNPLARRRKIRLAELHDLEWIVPTQESVAHASVREYFRKEGLAMPARRVESVSILTNAWLVSDAAMVALMPASVAERFARAGMVSILPMEGLGPFSDVGYTVRSDRPPGAATQRFLAALHDVGRELQR